MFDFMIPVIRPLYFVTLCALFYVPAKHALHMYQQNRYEIRRYLQWFTASLSTSLFPIIGAVVLGIVMSFIITVLGVLGQLIVLVILAWTAIHDVTKERRKHYIKPLKLTARVKRQVVVLAIMNLVLITVMVSHYLLSPLPLIALMYATSIVHILLILMAAITIPIEALIKAFYMDLARRELRRNPNLITIGIAGSYGKTSSKNILNEILSEQYYTLATPASFNTPMGITLTVRNELKNLHQVFIAELGADKVGDLSLLMRFVRPKYGILTSIGPEHLNTFKNIQNIIKEETKVVEMLPEDGVAVVNADNEYIRAYAFKNPVKRLTVGIDYPDVDYRAISVAFTPEGSVFTIVSDDGSVPFKTRLLGKHNITNILVAVALGRELGLSWSLLQKAVANVNYIEHRLQLKKINGLTYIDNAFNSNPEGSLSSLEVLKMMPGRRYIVTPGMIDLGDQQRLYNYTFGKAMLGCADMVLLVGPTQSKPIYEGLADSGYPLENVRVFDTVKEAFAYLDQHASPKDTILLENDLPDAFNR